MAGRRDAESHFQEGLRLLRAGEPQAAVRSLRRALDRDPKHLEAVCHLAEAYAAARTWSRAVDAYRAALRIVPQRPDLWTSLGYALFRAGCHQAAVSALERAARLDGDEAAAFAGKGRALSALRHHEAAAEALSTAARLRPDDFGVHRDLAAALSVLQRHDEAIAVWDAYLERHPDYAPAQSNRRLAERLMREDGAPPPDDPPPLDDASQLLAWAEALAEDDRTDESLDAIREALRLRSDLPGGHRALGLRYLALDRPRDAIESFGSALGARPDDAVAAAGLARAQDRLGRHHSALKAYEHALQLAPDDPDVLTDHGDLLRRLQRHDEALEGYDAALIRAPHHKRALAGRASSLTSKGAFAEALPVWRRVLRIDPDHAAASQGLRRCEREIEASEDGASDRAVRGVARIHFDLGKSMLQQSRYAEAVAAFRKASEVRAGWADPHFYAAVSLARSGDEAGALGQLDAALDAEPGHVEAACLKGDLRRLVHDIDGARAAYDRALAHAPTMRRALGGRAECLRLQGQHEAATALFQQVLDEDPRDLVALCGLAATHLATGELDHARRLFERARQLRPEEPFVLQGLAQCDNAGLTYPDDTREDVTRQTVPPPPRTTPEDRRMLARQAAADELDRGRSFHKERNYTAAIGAFRRAIDLDPTFAEAALRLGMAYEDDRQFRRAIAAYEAALDIEPNHAQAATNIGESHRKNEQYLEAIRAYDRALEIKSDYLYALAGRAECLRMLGRYEQSLEWFDRSLEVGANHAFAIQGKAAALNALRRFREAAVLWDRALEIEPMSPFAKDGKTYCDAQLRRLDGGGEEAPASSPDDDTDDEPVESSTPTLDEQGRDLTALAHADRLPEVVGREAEIRAVMKTLMRRLKANPLLLGEPGVGKTAVVEGVAKRLAADDVPPRLRGLRILELSMGTLVAGTKYRGTFEERIREIVREASDTPGIVLFVDEIHTLVGAGRTEGGSLDAANILKPALARGEITVIGATTHDEYRRHFESDSALERRFQPIQIEEPSEPDCVELLDRLRRRYEAHHGVSVTPEALEACVRMSVRYVPERRLPDKALDLLDEACAEVAIDGEDTVEAETVARVVSERTGVEVTRLSTADRARVSSMDEALRQRVVGQDDAVRRLSDAVRLTKAGLRAEERPRGVFLFRGASGVGKTELAKALSDFLFPEGDALIRLDMSEYADRFTTSRLVGAPPGYSGHGNEGLLTGPLRRHPYSVVLLDEFEKAHPEVQSLFLSMFDEGRITDSEGRVVNARECFVILTTNAGQERRGKGRVGFGGDARGQRERALDELAPYFRPELLNRIDEVIDFEPLGPEDLEGIVTRHLEQLAVRASARGAEVLWDHDVVAHLAGAGAAEGDGARPALRAVDTLLAEPLGRRMLAEDAPEGPHTWYARLVEGRITLECRPRSRTSPTPALQR